MCDSSPYAYNMNTSVSIGCVIVAPYDCNMNTSVSIGCVIVVPMTTI